MIYGYAGTILRINLSTNKIVKTPLKKELVEEYVGGRGFTAKILYDENPPNVHPFSPENIFIVAMGPLSGHMLPSSGKTHFATKSPATGGYGDSNMGGHFGVTMKYAGYDVMIIDGKAEKHSYILINDDDVKIVDAEKYWGRGSAEVEEAMKKDLGEDYQILTIGPAGENLVNFACISHDFGRQAGRIGIGAVLGSKNIKAIAVKGTKGIPVFDPELLLEKGKKMYGDLRKKPGFTGWTPQGTAGITDWCNNVGALPTRNFQKSNCDYAEKINGEAVLKELKITDKGCFSCPTPCGKYGHAKTKIGDAYVEGPEYETLSLLGSNCDISNIHDIAYLNYICDELGLDTCSAGVVLSFAFECFEKGLLTKEDVGMEVSFGDFESAVYLLRQIAERKGIGNVLAEGVRGAAATIGKGSDQFAIHVKGLEWTGYESRNAPGMMLGYMTADIGAHHGRCWVLGNDVAGSAVVGNVNDLISGEQNANFLPKAKHENVVPIVLKSQHIRPAFDIIGTCRLQFMEIGLETSYYEEVFYAITGRKFSWVELERLSEKLWHLNRMYNVREIEGFGRKFDYPPKRFYTEPIPDGPNKGHFIELEAIEEMLDHYYDGRGWDCNGIPTSDTLVKFGLNL
ncbi:MAG: aldehyde ferredoxin oxidoreductase [Acidaminobacter sp.]|uniref:aldehyde ferredoxin oxidoreductase family protein n=1 Tax=Acidaminobacter sp. TaxID=1872102 RepID=UPI001381C853|nr:aldehyde ferredoxin oxidoreductase family protein [Acidaminobacter sp.]MZQ99210.1 aldehyde ferredoxin oxidoreductase [Acidaminobacter sp.]